jgi:hypothetical protein
MGDRLRALPLVARVVQRVSPRERFTTVFSHAGMPPGLAEQTSLEDLNREIRVTVYVQRQQQRQRRQRQSWPAGRAAGDSTSARAASRRAAIKAVYHRTTINIYC